MNQEHAQAIAGQAKRHWTASHPELGKRFDILERLKHGSNLEKNERKRVGKRQAAVPNSSPKGKERERREGSCEGTYRRGREEMERGGLKETEVAGGGRSWRRGHAAGETSQWWPWESTEKKKGNVNVKGKWKGEGRGRWEGHRQRVMKKKGGEKKSRK
jgi:hypothetical protein